MPLYSRSFFKILVHSKFQEELMFPKSFVRGYWKRISNPIVLKLPNGAEQEVHWTKREDNIWLEKGWEKVVELCCLKYEYVLLFKYNGGSCFKVKVYDKSSSQIYYSSLRCDEETTKDCEVGNDECIEISDETDTPEQIRKRKKTNTGKRAARRSLLEARKNLETVPKKKPLEDSQCNNALEKATAFSSKLKSPFFIRDMKPSYLRNDFVHLPSWFSRQYLYALGGRATIGVGGDMTQAVEYHFCKSDDRTTIKSGWRSFCQKYELEAGDVCVFERTKAEPLSFKIKIFRAREEPSSDQLQADQRNHNKPERGRAQHMEWDNGESGKRKRNEGISRSFPIKIDVLEGSQNMQANQFEIHIKEYHVKKAKYAHIPNEFMNSHSGCRGKNVHLQVGKMSWTVKVLHRGRFSAGWAAFVRECKLNIGDRCAFKMIEEENLVFKVSISREHH